MSTSYTTKAKLGTPAPGDTGFTPVFQANAARIDGLLGGLCVTPHEVPTSSSLAVDVAAGSFVTPWGSVVLYAGAAGFAVPASQSTALWLDVAGTLHSGPSFPSGSFYVPLATVAAGASAITSVADMRIICGAVNAQPQPVMGPATAGATYGANEQSMLQAVYNAARALGLGS